MNSKIKKEKMLSFDYVLEAEKPPYSNMAVPYTAAGFMKMSQGEKVQFIIDTYFTQKGSDDTNSKRAKDDAYIRSLPADGSCPDMYDQCQTWARNGECTINPEYMLTVCPGSCKSCKLNPQQIENIVKIYNSRDPPACVDHKADYPGNDPYMNKLSDYNIWRQ